MRLETKAQCGLGLVIAITTLAQCAEWVQISQTRTTYLEVYKNYIDAVVMHFDVPENAVGARFKFRGRNSMSNFGCPAHAVELHLQYGAAPVISPDGSTFPRGFLLSRREEIRNVSFKTDQVHSYIDIATPTPGSYYAAVFFPYEDPKEQGITQDGLFPVCNSFVDGTLLVQTLNITPIVSAQSFRVLLRPEDVKLYKMYVPRNVYKVVLLISEYAGCARCAKEIQAAVYSSAAASSRQSVTISGNSARSFDVLGDEHYYIKMTSFANPGKASNETTSFTAKIQVIETPYVEDEDKLASLKKNWPKVGANFTKEDQTRLAASYKDMFSMNASRVYVHGVYSPVAMQYDEYALYKTVSSDSFRFGYELAPAEDGYVPISINVSSVGFTVLKFGVRDVLDVGGTLNVALAYRPRMRREGRRIYVDREPRKHTIVACFHRAGVEVPIWENKCLYSTRVSPSPLVLNDTVTNATFVVPYPEPGNWYLSFKLFCGGCAECDCSKECRTAMEECLISCEANCGDDCANCQDKCERVVVDGKDGCKGCDCDGNCLSPSGPEDVCNSSVLYDVVSYPCVVNKCGSNGKCSFGLSEGFIYSTCVCSNNYRGWDCEDDTNANSLFTIWLELSLLVCSNFAFFLTVYVAYRRAYYAEALAYASILVASTFYHACDAGENRINFCPVALGVLQFCDFYCAILSIWATLVAMAYLPPPAPHLLHVGGAIFLGAAVTMDKTSLWVFVVPVTIGALVVLASWGHKNYKIRKGREPNAIKCFPSKRYLTIYLPVGLLVALAALLAFALFQTKSNYKYVHSMWHVMMAVAVVILLPREDLFAPKPDIVHNESTNNSF